MPETLMLTEIQRIYMIIDQSDMNDLILFKLVRCAAFFSYIEPFIIIIFKIVIFLKWPKTIKKNITTLF